MSCKRKIYFYSENAKLSELIPASQNNNRWNTVLIINKGNNKQENKTINVPWRNSIFRNINTMPKMHKIGFGMSLELHQDIHITERLTPYRRWVARIDDETWPNPVKKTSKTPKLFTKQYNGDCWKQPDEP